MNSKIKNIIAMSIFGTIGLFRKYIPLSSSIIAMIRGFVGMIFLLCLVYFSNNKLDKKAIKKNIIPLLFSGAFLGLNWMLLFEAYNYTSVAVATLCYYMAPIFIIIASPFALKEKITFKKMICVVLALVGMIFVSGVLSPDSNVNLLGVLFGLAAAVLYAIVVFINKKINAIEPIDKTIIQLGISTLVLLPYVFYKETIDILNIEISVILLLAVVGVVHTGIAYSMYFSSIKELKASEVALFSYIDPIIAIIISTFVLFEPINVVQIVGIVLVLGSTIISETIS